MKKQKVFLDKTRLDILKEIEQSPKKFVELKKKLKIQSNLLSYNLKILEKEELINKKEYRFYLTDKAKYSMPYARKSNDASQFPIPCVATIVTEKNKILIRKKQEEPIKGRSIFIGGKLMLGENIFDACKRHTLEKAEIEIKDLKLICINNFISIKGKETAHFVVFFVKAKLKSGIPKNAIWKQLVKIKEKMYPDNKYVLKHFLKSKKTNFIQSIYNEDKDLFKAVNIS